MSIISSFLYRGNQSRKRDYELALGTDGSFQKEKSVNGTYGDNQSMLFAKRFFKSFEVELLRPNVCDKP